MTYKSHFLPSDVYQYLLDVSLREPPILRELREVTLSDSAHHMMISPEMGQFFALLIKLIGARRTIEIGTYTGYSALSVALALPADGEIIACDVDEKTTAIAKQFWKRAGVADKIHLKIAPALNTLNDLIHAGNQNKFDFIFIDADKKNNSNYYEKALILARPGGLIAVDNVLWYGRVADKNNQENLTQEIRVFNEKLLADTRVDLSMLPVGDGLTLARKKE